MFKKYFTLFIIASAIQGAVFADEAVFSNSENQVEHFTLKPAAQVEQLPEIPNEEIPVLDTPKAETTAVQIKPSNSQMSHENYLNAINNLDNAQVELREQMANYSALMAQAKSEYIAKKNEYNNYKKQYNDLKKKMDNIEASKKKIQENVNAGVPVSTPTVQQ